MPPNVMCVLLGLNALKQPLLLQIWWIALLINSALLELKLLKI